MSRPGFFEQLTLIDVEPVDYVDAAEAVATSLGWQVDPWDHRRWWLPGMPWRLRITYPVTCVYRVEEQAAVERQQRPTAQLHEVRLMLERAALWRPDARIYDAPADVPGP